VGHRAPGARDGKAAQAKKVVSHTASSPRGEPSCQIVQRALEDARVSLERRRENHDRTIKDIGEAGKNVKVTRDPVYNPGCLALTRQQRCVVWPDKFRTDIGARYDGTSNPSSFSAFSTGVADIKMKEKLSVNDELTSVIRLFEIANRCAKAKEGRLFVHNLPEALPPKPKSKDPKRKEAPALTAEPDHKQCCGDRSERDKGGRRRYCILHKRDTHNTNDYWVVRKFHEENGVTKRRGSSHSYGKGGSRGDRRDVDRDNGPRRDGLSCADPEPLPLPPPVNDHREENQGGYQEPRGFAACLLGGAQAPLSNHHFKQLSREIAAAQPNINSHRLKWSTSKIGFDEEDHPISTKAVGTIPLLCTPTINNIAINPTLINGGAGLNFISIEVFEKMQVPYHRLMPTRPFFRVTEGSTMPIGQVCLPVTFGTRDNYRIESLDFDVAYIALPYNTILGYPALARFMAAMHHGFNVLKIPGANGTITVRCNEKDALRSVENVYREAATMFPTDEVLLEHSGDLTRKKQLMSEERAAANKASLEPLLPGLLGKKFAASTSTMPSKDLVHPMLDMSIGEAAVLSGRRPQFTQECSATKKIPLQARGCENFITIRAGLSPK
jgi:hypothetical protein